MEVRRHNMFNIVNIEFTTGSVEVYTVPEDIGSIAIHAVDGDIIMMSELEGDEWTISEGEKGAVPPLTNGWHGSVLFSLLTNINNRLKSQLQLFQLPKLYLLK
jgi:hypothetical protein